MIRLTHYTNESMLFREGDEGDGLYIIDDGSVRGWVRDKKLRSQPLQQEMAEGSIVGEIAFFLASKRTASL